MSPLTNKEVGPPLALNFFLERPAFLQPFPVFAFAIYTRKEGFNSFTVFGSCYFSFSFLISCLLITFHKDHSWEQAL